MGRALEALCRTANTSLLSNSTDFTDKSDWESFLARFRDTTEKMERRLTVTNQGYVGMAPCRARKGDIICVLLGCSIPIVLQEHEDEDSYEFVGKCYLHRFMNGEILEKVDSQRRRIERFWLS
jgi:hypothetical protein